MEEDEEIEELDLAKILENVQIESYLEGKTMKDVSQEIYDSLLVFTDEVQREKYYTQLVDYRYVEKVCDLRLGVYTKCLSVVGNKVGKGGILVKVDVYEDKISLLCKTGAYFQRHSFNDSVIFQKLSLEEKMVLFSCDYYTQNSGDKNS
jgi:hypothetical protein